jgi:hypothetical protein
MSGAPKLEKGWRPFYRTQSPTRLAKWKSQSPGFRTFGQKFVQLGRPNQASGRIFSRLANGHWRSPKSLTNTLKRIGFATSLNTARIEKWPQQSKYRAGFFGELERRAR